MKNVANCTNRNRYSKNRNKHHAFLLNPKSKSGPLNKYKQNATHLSLGQRPQSQTNSKKKKSKQKKTNIGESPFIFLFIVLFLSLFGVCYLYFGIYQKNAESSRGLSPKDSTRPATAKLEIGMKKHGRPQGRPCRIAVSHCSVTKSAYFLSTYFLMKSMASPTVWTSRASSASMLMSNSSSKAATS